MFQRFSRTAEQVATSTSRRAFLGRLGRGALAVTGVLAGVLAAPAVAEAAGGKCCCGLFGGDIFDCYRKPKGAPRCEDGYSACRCTNTCR